MQLSEKWKLLEIKYRISLEDNNILIEVNEEWLIMPSVVDGPINLHRWGVNRNNERLGVMCASHLNNFTLNYYNFILIYQEII